jgi:hypothetical protein
MESPGRWKVLGDGKSWEMESPGRKSWEKVLGDGKSWEKVLGESPGRWKVLGESPGRWKVLGESPGRKSWEKALGENPGRKSHLLFLPFLVHFNIKFNGNNFYKGALFCKNDNTEEFLDDPSCSKLSLCDP